MEFNAFRVRKSVRVIHRGSLRLQPAAESGPIKEGLVPERGASRSLSRKSDGYTMIVGSTSSNEKAVQSIARFASFGLPYGVLRYDEDGHIRYRMALGLFQTVSEARKILHDLADRLPAGTWIRSIR